MYYISRGRLRPANKQFNTTKNDYELTLNEDSEIELVRIEHIFACVYSYYYGISVQYSSRSRIFLCIPLSTSKDWWCTYCTRILNPAVVTPKAIHHYIMYFCMRMYITSDILSQCTDSVSDSQLPTVQYNFRTIADLESIEPNQLVGKLISSHLPLACHVTQI